MNLSLRMLLRAFFSLWWEVYCLLNSFGHRLVLIVERNVDLVLVGGLIRRFFDSSQFFRCLVEVLLVQVTIPLIPNVLVSICLLLWKASLICKFGSCYGEVWTQVFDRSRTKISMDISVILTVLLTILVDEMCEGSAICLFLDVIETTSGIVARVLVL